MTEETPRQPLRAAELRDLERTRELLQSLDLPVDGLEDQFDRGYVVIEQSGKVAGVAGMEIHGPYGLMRSIAVDPQSQGSGLGHYLTDDRLRWARGKKLRAVYLLTTTAGRFFPRFGFRVISRDRVPPEIQASGEFSESCPESATVMVLDLP